MYALCGTRLNAGASSAITQYFFNADSYFHLVEKVQKPGVYIPSFPASCPSPTPANLMRFSDSCGADSALDSQADGQLWRRQRQHRKSLW
jgi:5,10-methylenetetrahydrofolate reductase